MTTEQKYYAHTFFVVNLTLIFYHEKLRRYTLHGEILLDIRNGTYDERHKFTGYEKDGESGLNYASARYDNSEFGIFISTDPMWYKYPHLTPYNYCLNNPVQYTDPTGMWVPDADGNLVAEKGDNEETLKTYLSTIYDGTDKISDDEWNSFSSQINSAANASETGDITGTKLNSTNGTFDNLVGKYLYTQSQKNSSWAVTRFPGNNCSPTTFNRVDKAMEFVYGKDILGKLSWNNSIYKNWQGAGAGLFGTGVISSMGYGSLVSEQDILGGSLQTGALLRMTQVPGPGGTSVSWHAVIFLNYTYDNSGNINGMTYWQQVDELINTINFNSNNGGTYNFSNGYKPKLGTNFK